MVYYASTRTTDYYMAQWPLSSPIYLFHPIPKCHHPKIVSDCISAFKHLYRLIFPSRDNSSMAVTLGIWASLCHPVQLHHSFHAQAHHLALPSVPQHLSLYVFGFVMWKVCSLKCPYPSFLSGNLLFHPCSLTL